MDKTVRKITDFAEQQAETYRYWQSVSDSERMNATWELTKEHYRRLDLWHEGIEMDKSLVRTFQGPEE